MIAESCLLCLYKARPLCVDLQKSILICLARHCNSNCDWSQEFVSHIKTTKKTTNPRLRWKRFLSDLTPRLPSKPAYRPKSMDKSLAMSLGPPSISSLFFTKINTSLFSNIDDIAFNSPFKYYKNNNKSDLALSSKTLRSNGLKLGKVKFNRNMSFAKTKSKPQHRSDYLSKSVSKWTLKMFSKYMDLDEHVEELFIDTEGVDFSREMAEVIQEMLDMFDTSRRKPSLHDVLSSESDVRIFLAALLKNLCPKLGVSLKTEERIHLVQLPICKFDFLFLTHDGKPIGCMEAKVASTMTSKSFVQAVVQLLLLHFTDGKRFVLLQVMGEKLFLEYVSRGGYNVLKIRSSKVMEALFNLIKMTLNCKP